MSNEIQQGLQDDLTTIEPDLMNMTRLFSLPDSVWDAPEYHFAAAIEGGQYVIRFYGKTQAAQGVTDIPSDADARIQALHRRRALRRLCRQTLYDLLRKETGIHPPWGSMTGIRPTHLHLPFGRQRQARDAARRAVLRRVHHAFQMVEHGIGCSRRTRLAD